jgi:hypothetical protein
MRSTDAAAAVDRVVAQLEKRAAQLPGIESEWPLRLIQMALGRDREAASISSALSPDARRVLAALIQVASAARGAAADSTTVGDDLLNKVDELKRSLTEKADPVVSSVSLCRKVVTFGVYDEMKNEEFVSGRTTQTIVYCEIRNFRSDETEDHKFRTVLATRLEVLSAAGTSVWQREEPAIEDVCRRRRSDFFLAQRITLPATLPAGEYVLKVFVEDKLAGKADEATRPFTMMAANSVAATR